MAKKRKSLGKVKRYRHKVRSNKSVALGVLFWLVLIVGALAGGYLVAPRVIDFGTSTWYSLTAGLGGEDDIEEDHLPEETATPTPAPTATAAPVQTVSVVDGNWADVSLSALTTTELMQQTIETLAAQGVTYVVVQLKDTSGYLHYQSSIENASASIAATTIDAQAVAATISQAGMIPVAAIATFQDPLSVYQDRSMGIQYQETEYRWLDNTADAGGKAWMNPYSDTAVTFIGDIIAEVVSLGYEHVVLGQVQFPAQVSGSQNFGSIGDMTRADALRAAIAAWGTRFAEEKVVLWYEYSYDTCLSESTITGELPSTLGIENVIVTLPLATADDPTPDTSALAEIAATFTESGSAYVVVQDGSTATFYE